MVTLAKIINTLAQNLGPGVIAEGVEALRSATSWLFSRPLPVDLFEEFARQIQLAPTIVAFNANIRTPRPRRLTRCAGLPATR